MDNGWNGILVYLQIQSGTIHPVSLEMITLAKELTAEKEVDIFGVAIGEWGSGIREEIERLPLRKAIVFETSGVFKSDLYGDLFVQSVNELRPSVVLIGSTDEGRALAPRIAIELRTGMTADCTSLSFDESGNLVQVRPAYGGDIMARILTEHARPQIATVRENRYKPYNDDGLRCRNIQMRLVKDCSRIFVMERKEVRIRKRMDDLKVALVAGRGLREKKDLEMLSSLAEALGGELAATRGLVEKGWISHDRQIGLSGQVVNARLLMTFGVSGSVQFMAGLGQIGCLVAINNDPEAPIFSIAHYAVCCDLYEVVPKVLHILTDLQ